MPLAKDDGGTDTELLQAVREKVQSPAFKEWVTNVKAEQAAATSQPLGTQAQPKDAVSSQTEAESRGFDGLNFRPDAILNPKRVTDEYVVGPWKPDYGTIFGATGDTTELGKTGKKDTRRELQNFEVGGKAAVSTKSRPEAEAKLNRETAKGARARDGSKLEDRGPVKARATEYAEEPEPAVTDWLARVRGTDGRNPITGEEYPNGSDYADMDLGDKSVDDLTTDESLAMTTRLAREALEKGLKGRAVQSYVQERQGMPGMESFQREETARLNKADVEKEMAESEERATRAGMNRGKKRDTETMTAEDYAALTPKQKAAVDLNTLLVAAVQRDLGVKRDEGKQYDDRVKAVFGDDASTIQPFAPNTLSLLEDIGYQDDNTKVTDFLKLKAAFDADDVDDLKLRKGEAPDANSMSAGFSRDAIQADLVATLQGARTDKDTRGTVLDTQRDLLGTDQKLGFGEANPEGDRTSQLNAYFQQAFEAMSTKGVDPTAIMAEARDGRMDERELKAFIEFLDVKSRESKQFDIPLGTDPETEYKPTRKFRAQLQLNK